MNNHKIVSVSTRGITLKDQLSELVHSTNKDLYLEKLSDILRSIRLDGLGQTIQDAWENAPVGFHTHEIAKIPIPHSETKVPFRSFPIPTWESPPIFPINFIKRSHLR